MDFDEHQRVPAEIKEIVMHADALKSENFLPDVSQIRFDIVDRKSVCSVQIGTRAIAFKKKKI